MSSRGCLSLALFVLVLGLGWVGAQTFGFVRETMGNQGVLFLSGGLIFLAVTMLSLLFAVVIVFFVASVFTRSLQAMGFGTLLRDIGSLLRGGGIRLAGQMRPPVPPSEFNDPLRGQFGVPSIDVREAPPASPYYSVVPPRQLPFSGDRAGEMVRADMEQRRNESQSDRDSTPRRSNIVFK